MTKNLCKRYYGRLLTGKGQTCPQACSLYHPLKVTNQGTKEYNRKLGRCYCGSELMTVICHKNRFNEKEPRFFVICSKTRRSMRGCQ